MALDDAGEFHPYVFCVLKKAGRDPWADLVWMNTQLGIDTTHWPKRPPVHGPTNVKARARRRIPLPDPDAHEKKRIGM
jgi:hypothetical protein